MENRKELIDGYLKESESNIIGRVINIQFNDGSNMLAVDTQGNASIHDKTVHIKDPIYIYFEYVQNSGSHLRPSKFSMYTDAREFELSSKNIMQISVPQAELAKAYATFRYYLYDWHEDESLPVSEYFASLPKYFCKIMDRVEEYNKKADEIASEDATPVRPILNPEKLTDEDMGAILAESKASKYKN